MRKRQEQPLGVKPEQQDWQQVPVVFCEDKSGRIGYRTRAGDYAWIDEVGAGCLWNLLKRLDAQGHHGGRRWQAVHAELVHRGEIEELRAAR